MDNVTHTLFGATLARTPLARAGRGTTAALLLASNAPDIDIVAALGGGSIKYLEWHRGPTHGPLGVVALAAVTASIVWAGRRFYDRRNEVAARGDNPSEEAPLPDASFATLVAVSAIGVVFHILMDLPTSYGTRVLSPFSWRWYAVDWMPIVDIYMLMVMVAALFGRSNETQRRTKAAIVLTLVAANYGLRAMSHYQALEVAPRLFGPTLPERCDPPPEEGSRWESWPRPTPSPPSPGRRCLVELAAMPSFASPFRWRIIAQMSNAYEIHDIDLLDSRFRNPDTDSDVPWRLTLRYPNLWTPAVDRAATTKLGQVFLGFSRFPAARTALDAHGATTVRWSDMRFAGGIAGLEQPTRSVNPFTAIIRIDPAGRVVEERIVR